MHKVVNVLMCLLILCSFFGPFIPSAKAAGAYSVVMVSGTSGNKTVGSYSTYSEAVSVMNKQNSTSTNVATVYKNGKVINARYAIFKLKPAGNATSNVYQNVNDSSAYTYINASSMLDTAFIDYNESKNRVQIMVNGFKGWVDAGIGEIKPLSLYSANMIEMSVSGLNFRSGPSTSSSSIGAITCTKCQFAYTSKTYAGGRNWYQITYNDKTGWVAGDWAKEVTGNSLNTYFYRYDNGNLLHRFAYHTGTIESDYFTNLGPSPTYLSVGTHYYSFDGGIYLYTSLTSMLDDYRNNTYKNALNKDNPNYPYYLYAPAKTISKATAADMDKQITNKSSKMYGSGKYFKEVEEMYGVNALSMFSVAKNESSSGTSKIAMNKNNLFGYGANDSDPYNSAKTYASVKDSIIDYAKNYLEDYALAEAQYYFGSHEGNKGSGRNVKYASDPLSGEKAAASNYTTDKNTNGLKDYKSNTIAVSKFGKSNIVVYKDASTKTPIYTMRNKNSSFKVANVPVNVIDKEGDFYKIYTDSNKYQYGYVKVSDFNITNTQPVINASDQTININTSFDYKRGVTASDKEDGNLTSKITYTGEVNTAKAGTYKITYKVTDNSNFSATKTVNITVKDNREPVINASDKEVSQYTTFDYMDGVTAIEGSTDITDKVTYTETVDTENIGKYEVTYTVVGTTKTVTKTINVSVVANEKPVINAVNKTINLNEEFDPKEGITASDKEDGDLTKTIKVIKNEVKTDTIGDYKVIYEVTDKAGQTVTKEIIVTVAEKVLAPADGLFYIDYLDNVNGNLQLKGYNTIRGIDNDLNTNIEYKLILKNIDSGRTYEQEGVRITNEKEIPFDVYSSDGKNYRYSWFTINLDFTNIPNGNYTAMIKSIGEDFTSENVLNNKTNSKQITSYKGSKNVVIRNNYNYDNSPIEFIVRENLLADKTAGSYYNQFDNFTEFNFKGDKLHLRGMSYSYGMKLDSNLNVTRKIIFENQKTYETYVKDLGTVTNGDYTAVLPESDNLDKTRAWYDNDIDISDLPKGKYTIYITTSSNITDISEFTEKLGRELNEVKKEINGKNYSFNINYSKNSQIELIIE